MNTFLQAIFMLCILGFHAAVAQEIIYARVGDDVSLNLPYDSNKYFTWAFNNKQVGWTNPSGGKKIEPEWATRVKLSPTTLVIKNITQKDFGIFSCSVKEKIQEIAKQVFKVIQLDVIVNSPILLSGENLFLSCNIRNQEYSPNIFWVNPHGDNMEKNELNVNASVSNSGLWTCVVKKNEEEKTRAKIKVTVIDLLSAPIPTWYASTSNPSTIPCFIPANTTWDDVKAKGIQEVGWYFCPPSTATSLKCNKSSLCSLSLEKKPTWMPRKDKTLRPSPNPSNGNLSLGRNQWKGEDSGDYVCFMKFQNGVNLSRTVHVELLQIIPSPGTELISGQQLNLTCTTGHPLPSDLQVKWIPPNEASLLHPSIHDPRSPYFTIPEVGTDEKGTWRCELWRGETLLTSAVVALNIEPKISVWMLVTLCAAAVIFVLLLVLIVILHRRKQRRTRRHKRLCHCKNPKPKGFYRS